MGIRTNAIVGVGAIVEKFEDATALLRERGFINDDNIEEFESDFEEFCENLPFTVICLNYYTGNGFFVGVELDESTLGDIATIKDNLTSLGFAAEFVKTSQIE